MSPATGDRTKQFPLIEKKYGHPIDFWLKRLKELGTDRYQAQSEYLQEEFGFSRAHANTVIMYSRGSTSTKAFSDAEGYFATLPDVQAATLRNIIEVVRKKHKNLEVVISWNKPMIKIDGQYILGLAAVSNHMLLLPWGDDMVNHVKDRTKHLVVNKKTIQIPNDWKIDRALINELVAERLRQLEGH